MLGRTAPHRGRSSASPPDAPDRLHVTEAVQRTGRELLAVAANVPRLADCEQVRRLTGAVESNLQLAKRDPHGVAGYQYLEHVPIDPRRHLALGQLSCHAATGYSAKPAESVSIAAGEAAAA